MFNKVRVLSLAFIFVITFESCQNENLKFPAEGSTEKFIFTIDSSIITHGITKVAATTLVEYSISLIRQQELVRAAYYMTPSSPELKQIKKFIKETADFTPAATIFGQFGQFNWDEYNMSIRKDTILLSPNDSILPPSDSMVLSADMPKTYELILLKGKYLRYNRSWPTKHNF